MRAMVATLITSAHNLVLVPVLWLTIAPAPSWSTLLFIPAVALLLLNVGWFALVVGPLSTRYRDINQIVQNVLQLFFYMTPVIYRKSQVQGTMATITEFNPFAHLMEILRAPLLGETPAARHFVVVGALACMGYLIALPSYARTRPKIAYWL
jgi:ABC-type polysaccharide/polyol phosphate export permease